MPFNDFFHEYSLGYKATSNSKIQQILSSLSLTFVESYLENGPFTTDARIVTLHATKGTYWVANKNQNCFQSYGGLPTEKRSKFVMSASMIVRIANIRRSCLYSEKESNVSDTKEVPYFAAEFLYKYYLTRDLGMDFESAVFNFYYQIIQ